jgi:hypothetical protein
LSIYINTSLCVQLCRAGMRQCEIKIQPHPAKNDAVTEELNGLKINIDQESPGLDQIQAFKNMDRANASDYSYDQIASYNKTEGYKERFHRHNEWLLINNNY